MSREKRKNVVVWKLDTRKNVGNAHPPTAGAREEGKTPPEPGLKLFRGAKEERKPPEPREKHELWCKGGAKAP